MRTKTIVMSGILSIASCMVGAADTGTVQRITAVSTQTTDRVDITTLNGVTYTNCRISRAEPDGITVFYAKGIAKIPFAELPEEYRTKYNYNPTNAAAYTRAVNQRQSEAWTRQQTDLKKQQQQTVAEEARRAADAAAKRSAAVQSKTPPSGVVRVSEEEDAEIPSGQNVTVIIERKKSQSELLGEVYDRRYKEAKATKGIVRQVGESQAAFEARRKAAIDAALGHKSGN
jgi:hypothetical protein